MPTFIFRELVLSLYTVLTETRCKMTTAISFSCQNDTWFTCVQSSFFWKNPYSYSNVKVSDIGYVISSAAVTKAIEEEPSQEQMTNHVNGKISQGMENHDSIVSSYKELIREQVGVCGRLESHYFFPFLWICVFVCLHCLICCKLLFYYSTFASFCSLETPGINSGSFKSLSSSLTPSHQRVPYHTRLSACVEFARPKFLGKVYELKA